MPAYVVLMFCTKEDLKSYGIEVATAIKSIAGARFKCGEGAAGIVAIAFATDKEWSIIARTFRDLWRPEQRCWVLPLEGDMMIDKALIDWSLKA